MERDMRLVHVVSVFMLAQFAGPALGDGCELASIAREAAVLPASRLVTGSYSSFHGISLDSTPADVVAAAEGRGFIAVSSTFVDSEAVAAIHLRAKPGDCADVGIVEFTRDGRPTRIQLGARYFCSGDVSVGEFARRLFRTYAVRTDKVADDNCFQDVTCFRGQTPAREKVMVLKLSYQPEVFVRPSED
jgi:hypothetical protein